MDALGNLDSFIAGCDATKMGAFLELVQRRFSEAQLQRQKKLESVVSNMHKQLLEASAAKKQQLREQIGSSLAALSSKRDAAAAELTQSLEAARAKKQQLLLSFQEQEKACQEIEDEVKELTSLFVAKQQEMEKRHKQTLRAFFETAVQKVNQARNGSFLSFQEKEKEKEKIKKTLLELLLALGGPPAMPLLASLQNN